MELGKRSFIPIELSRYNCSVFKMHEINKALCKNAMTVIIYSYHAFIIASANIRWRN